MGTIAQLHAGKQKALAKRKADFLDVYDHSKPVTHICRLAGIEYTTYAGWLRKDDEFKAAIDEKVHIYRLNVVKKIEAVAEKAALGEIYTETTYRDGDGNIKQSATYQQQPSYKHAELLLRAYDPDTYKPEQAAGVAVTINLAAVSGTDEALETDAIDITDDPGAFLNLF